MWQPSLSELRESSATLSSYSMKAPTVTYDSKSASELTVAECKAYMDEHAMDPGHSYYVAKGKRNKCGYRLGGMQKAILKHNITHHRAFKARQHGAY